MIGKILVRKLAEVLDGAFGDEVNVYRHGQEGARTHPALVVQIDSEEEHELMLGNWQVGLACRLVVIPGVGTGETSEAEFETLNDSLRELLGDYTALAASLASVALIREVWGLEGSQTPEDGYIVAGWGLTVMAAALA